MKIFRNTMLVVAIVLTIVVGIPLTQQRRDQEIAKKKMEFETVEFKNGDNFQLLTIQDLMAMREVLEDELQRIDLELSKRKNQP